MRRERNELAWGSASKMGEKPKRKEGGLLSPGRLHWQLHILWLEALLSFGKHQEQAPSYSFGARNSSSFEVAFLSGMNSEYNNCIYTVLANKSDLGNQSYLEVEVFDFKDVCNINDLRQADNVQSVYMVENKSRKFLLAQGSCMPRLGSGHNSELIEHEDT
ncbi:hypothetical protein VNO77_04176 [Canavalia gladiata]|uniref:Uncharacterized protein n=1 Tax=Canavalia gladiata TaxID=3824 RepID=A0AAN9R7J3_CANGL